MTNVTVRGIILLKTMVDIFDNFLSLSELESINGYIRNGNIPWTIGVSDIRSPDNYLLSHDVTGHSYFNTEIFNKIQEKIGRCSLRQGISAIYFNGQSSGMDGSFHPDNPEECIDCKTVLIYLSPYDKEWGGFTQFWKSDEQQQIVAPIPGRMVSFNGSIMHKGYAYSRQNCPMRISLAYKLHSHRGYNEHNHRVDTEFLSRV